MIILVPEKSFRKKIEKWVKYKDFLIVDATDRHDGSMREYGNKIDADEMAPTPTLTLIATDPDDETSKVKRRRIERYIDQWLSDEGVNLKIHHIVGCILKSYNETGEDLNAFVVMRDPIFYAYHEAVENHINDDYGVHVAVGMTHKMDKEVIKEQLRREFKADHYKALKKAHKRIKKELNVEEPLRSDW
jgi:hypothetical protein